MLKRTFIFDKELDRVVERKPRLRNNLPTADRQDMDGRDGVMSLAEGESKHIADERLSKLITSGDFDKMYTEKGL